MRYLKTNGTIDPVPDFDPDTDKTSCQKCRWDGSYDTFS